MLPNNNEVTLYCDGACSGNPGVGGWACVLSHPAKELVLRGSALVATNHGALALQQMELTAVLEGLRALKRPTRVLIVSDSKYVTEALSRHDGISQWMPNWVRRNWHKVANVYLWKPIYELCQTHSVRTEWVKGHSVEPRLCGHPMNELCDAMAVEEINKVKRSQPWSDRALAADVRRWAAKIDDYDGWDDVD